MSDSYRRFQESGLYYLQSRYYNPEIGRFINADGFVSTGQGPLGNNMFAYCLNNPANYYDPCGTCVHNWKLYNCEKCDEFWNSVGEKCVEAYNTINSFYLQQTQLQIEIAMSQAEILSSAAQATYDAYMRSYSLQLQNNMFEAELINSAISTLNKNLKNKMNSIDWDNTLHTTNVGMLSGAAAGFATGILGGLAGAPFTAGMSVLMSGVAYALIGGITGAVGGFVTGILE